MCKHFVGLSHPSSSRAATYAFRAQNSRSIGGQSSRKSVNDTHSGRHSGKVTPPLARARAFKRSSNRNPVVFIPTESAMMIHLVEATTYRYCCQSGQNIWTSPRGFNAVARASTTSEWAERPSMWRSTGRLRRVSRSLGISCNMGVYFAQRSAQEQPPEAGVACNDEV